MLACCQCSNLRPRTPPPPQTFSSISNSSFYSLPYRQTTLSPHFLPVNALFPANYYLLLSFLSQCKPLVCLTFASTQTTPAQTVTATEPILRYSVPFLFFPFRRETYRLLLTLQTARRRQYPAGLSTTELGYVLIHPSINHCPITWVGCC